ncbi:MAG: hypothetical protein HQK53_09525 [Oligoflexia bacterium]|nr:hypothetical protein [Oligoflexia bacterium]
MGRSYTETPGIEVYPLKDEHIRYLNEIYKKLTVYNELLLHPNSFPRFYIIKNQTPFYFSLPRGSFFLSLGLLQKYIRNESDLISILCFEIIKNSLNLYPANIIVPKGFISTERIISLTRIPFDDKAKINNWAYFVLKRSGYDPYSFLTWIQHQNKNSIDFSLHLGDVKIITREEYSYKYFIANKNIDAKINKIKRNSSKEFYKFIYDLKKE